MSVLVLSEHDVRRLLDMESCIEAMEEVLASLARGELFQPLRSVARPPDARELARPDARPPRRRVAGVRAQGDRGHARQPHARPRRAPGRRSAPRRRHRAARRRAERIAGDGDPNGGGLGSRDARARPSDAQRVAILGAGVQARAHAHAMRAVLEDPEIRIWARNLDAAEQLAVEVEAVVVALPRRGALRRGGGLHDDELRASPSSSTAGSRPARTSTRSARAFRRRGSWRPRRWRRARSSSTDASRP